MKLEAQVVSLELAKDLRELGVTQDSLVYWIYYTRESLTERDWKQLSRKEFNMEEFEWGLDCTLCKRTDYIDRCSAYSVAELGEMLPEEYNTTYTLNEKEEKEWGAYKNRPYQTNPTVEAKTEADARAKMLIYLIKAGIIKVEEEGRE